MDWKVKNALTNALHEARVREGRKRSQASRAERIKYHEENVRRQELEAKLCTCATCGRQGTITQSYSHTKKMTSSPSSLAGLQPITAAELTLGREHKGRVLFCRVICDCLMMSSAMTLIEDERGDVLDLAIYDFPGVQSSCEAKALLFRGRFLAIKEPFFKVRADGSSGIRVDDYRDLVLDKLRSSIAEPFEPGLKVSLAAGVDDMDVMTTQPSHKNSDAGSMQMPQRQAELHRILTDAALLGHRDSGNRAFKAGHYSDAERSYTLALDIASKIANDSPTSCLEPLLNSGAALWSLYSNRCAARVHMGMPDLALDDAFNAHACAPADAPKPFFRCAQAMLAMGCHEDARDALERAQNLFPEQSELQKKRDEAWPTSTLHVGSSGFASIAAALDVAPSGAEIVVAPGVYHEHLCVTKSVTIRSLGSKPNEYSVQTFAQENEVELRVCGVAINVESSGPVRLCGLRIISEKSLEENAAAVYASSSLVILQHCALSSHCGPIIVSAWDSRVVAHHCAVHDGAQGGLLAVKNGALICEHTYCCRTAASGLEVRQGATATLKNCAIFENGEHGVFIWHGAGIVEVLDTEIHSHKSDSGILVMETQQTALVCSCRIYGNKWGVVAQQKGKVRVQDCHVYSNGDGVLIQDTGCATIVGNEIFGNDVVGVFVGYDHLGTACVVKNNIHDNTRGITLGTGKSNTVEVYDNEEHDNHGTQLDLTSLSMWPTSTKQMRKESLEKADRRWLKSVRKSCGGWVKSCEAATVVAVAHDKSVRKEMVKTFSCGHCGRVPPKDASQKYKKCAKCLLVSYCSVACQKAHWESHKATCIQPDAKHASFLDPKISV